jgi:hypothetical protein
MPAAMPSLFQAAYRAEVIVTDRESRRETPVVVQRDAAKLRAEFARDGRTIVLIRNPDQGRLFVVGELAGQRIALRGGAGEHRIPDAAAAWEEARAEAAAAGPCVAVGETGILWLRGEERACVSADGVLLSAERGGLMVWRTTALARGPQDAAAFAPPTGVPLIDVSGGGGLFDQALSGLGAP